jgi:hypothetical protein
MCRTGLSVPPGIAAFLSAHLAPDIAWAGCVGAAAVVAVMGRD